MHSTRDLSHDPDRTDSNCLMTMDRYVTQPGSQDFVDNKESKKEKIVRVVCWIEVYRENGVFDFFFFVFDKY